MNEDNLKEMIENNQELILEKWFTRTIKNPLHRGDLIDEADLKTIMKDFIYNFIGVLAIGDRQIMRFSTENKKLVFFKETAEKYLDLGISPSEMGANVHDLKRAIVDSFSDKIDYNDESFWSTLDTVDKLNQYMLEFFIREKDSIINNQKKELLELASPVIQLWEKVLVVPLIGTLDSTRTQVIMENLLNKIAETNTEIAIIDITGIAVVDTLVAQHLIKTIEASRLMGAKAIISGISPEIAQTIVRLGIDINNINTKSNLKSAFKEAVDILNRTEKQLGSLEN